MSDSSEPTKRSWPLFVLAVLAFIPGFGIFIGWIAVVWGLLSSRPRALLAAAIAGGGALLQVVGFVCWMALSQARSPALAQAMIRPTQKDLATVVGAIDQFHARRGVYPATLRDLQARGPTLRSVNIYDQAAGVFHLPQAYQYSVAADGRSFDVFSAGPDRKPGTADDIRPVLPDSVRARSGYRPSQF